MKPRHPAPRSTSPYPLPLTRPPRPIPKTTAAELYAAREQAQAELATVTSERARAEVQTRLVLATYLLQQIPQGQPPAPPPPPPAPWRAGECRVGRHRACPAAGKCRCACHQVPLSLRELT